MTCGIYKITNIINNKVYIGSSIHIEVRWKEHIKRLEMCQHINKHLQSSWDLYKKRNFNFEIIEKCEEFQLLNREQFWIDVLHPEYNILKFAGSSRNLIVNEETRKKIGEKSRGRKHTEETKKKISQKLSIIRKGNKYRLGSITSDETKQKISRAMKGHKRGNFQTGLKRSEETKKKIGISLRKAWKIRKENKE